MQPRVITAGNQQGTQIRMDAMVLPSPTMQCRLFAAGGDSILDVPQIIMLVLAVVCLTAVMLATRRRIRDSQRTPSHTARRQFAQHREQSRSIRDVEQVMLELDQLSRQIHGRIDTKLARLETLIRDADQRIEKLTRLADKADGRPRFEITLDEEQPREQQSDNPATLNDERHADVFQLADDGSSPFEIAQKLGRPVGEIELILALRLTREKSAEPAQPSIPQPSSSGQ
jgi:hypothetical protein